MKKNYIYFLILVIGTIVLTLLLASSYKKDVVEESFLYERLNKITATEFEEYIIENPNSIIYIGDKTNVDNNKFEKELIDKFEKLHLLTNVVYIEKTEINSSLQKRLKELYSFEYNENNLPTILVINDGEIIQSSFVDIDTDVDSVINYEVFK